MECYQKHLVPSVMSESPESFAPIVLAVVWIS